MAIFKRWLSKPVPTWKPEPSKTPWMDWMIARDGWTEFDHDKELSAYWKYSGLDYTTVIGADHAWCALTVNAALHDTGYKWNNRADALSFKNYGNPCELKAGCIVVFRWESGHHHVTFCDHIVNDEQVACMGGNQENSIKVSVYPRANIIAAQWPLKA